MARLDCLQLADEFSELFPELPSLRVRFEEIPNHEHLQDSYAEHRQDYDDAEQADPRVIELGKVPIPRLEASQHVLDLPSFRQVPSNNVDHVVDVLHLHLVEFFWGKSVEICNRRVAFRHRIVWIFLQQLEENCFSVECADCIVEAEFDFATRMLLLVPAFERVECLKTLIHFN